MREQVALHLSHCTPSPLVKFWTLRISSARGWDAAAPPAPPQHEQALVPGRSAWRLRSLKPSSLKCRSSVLQQEKAPCLRPCHLSKSAISVKPCLKGLDQGIWLPELMSPTGFLTSYLSFQRITFTLYLQWKWGIYSCLSVSLEVVGSHREMSMLGNYRHESVNLSSGAISSNFYIFFFIIESNKVSQYPGQGECLASASASLVPKVLTPGCSGCDNHWK